MRTLKQLMRPSFGAVLTALALAVSPPPAQASETQVCYQMTEVTTTTITYSDGLVVTVTRYKDLGTYCIG